MRASQGGLLHTTDWPLHRQWRVLQPPQGQWRQRPPAIVNAVLDAVLDSVAPLGIRDLNMPLTTEKLWQAIQQAETAR
jgi:hypothetical protein